MTTIIPHDFVYTGKAFFAMLKALRNGNYDNQPRCLSIQVDYKGMGRWFLVIKMNG
jgi:hypothetical protein